MYLLENLKKSLCTSIVLLMVFTPLKGDGIVNLIKNGDFEDGSLIWKKDSGIKNTRQTFSEEVNSPSSINTLLSIRLSKSKCKIISQKIKIDSNTKVFYLTFKYKKSINYKSANPAGLYNIRFIREDKSSNFFVKRSSIVNNKWGYDIIQFTKIKGKRKNLKYDELTLSIEFYEGEGSLDIDDIVLEAHSESTKNIHSLRQKKLSEEISAWNALLPKNTNSNQKLDDVKKEPLVNLVSNGDFEKGKRKWDSNTKFDIEEEDGNKYAVLHLGKMRNGSSFSQKISFDKDTKILEISFKSKSTKGVSGQLRCWGKRKKYTYYSFSTGKNQWKTTKIKFSQIQGRKSIKLDFMFKSSKYDISLDDITVHSITN